MEAVESIDPSIPIMMHIALWGQHDKSVFWFDNMIARGVRFDIIGLSYYRRWHGTLDDLKANLLALSDRYHKPLNVVEYSWYKIEVHYQPGSWSPDLKKNNGRPKQPSCPKIRLKD